MDCRPQDNPFNTRNVASLRYLLSERERARLLDELRAGGNRGALVGPEGSGKTTLMEDLRQDCHGRGWTTAWLQCFRDRRPGRGELTRLRRAAQVGACCFIDGAEALGSWRLRWLVHRLGSARLVLMTRHRPGVVPTLRQHACDPVLLEPCLRHLLGVEAERWLPEARRLWPRVAGNLRELWRELYLRQTGIDDRDGSP